MKKNMIIATRHGLIRFERTNDFWEERDYALTGVGITSIDMRGELGLVGTTDGVYISQDSGENWQLLRDGIQTPHVRWVSIHPQKNELIFAGTEPANIYFRQVDGERWQRSEKVEKLRKENDWYMPYSPNDGCVRGFAFHEQRIYASVEVGGMLISDDYGKSWDLVPGSSGKPHQDPEKGQIHPDVHSVATHASSGDLLFAPTGGGFYISEDGGESWDLKYQAYCRAVWVDPEDPKHMLLGPADGVGRGGRIERTTDGGESWELLMDNLVEKWPEAMVERFVASEDEIFAILSNGKVITTQRNDFSWQYLLPGIANVVMLALF
ncbi:MAG: WD40/YVTN/BNR-like repeat-containing protein [Brevefilum sp.]